MMSQQLEYLMNIAVRRANQLHHEYLTLEGVLLALMQDTEVAEVLESCGAKIEDLKIDLNNFLEDHKNFSILTTKQIEELGLKQFADAELRNLARQNGIYYQPEISLSLQRVIQRAAFHVQSSGKQQIKAINILVAMYQEKESFAVYLLEKQGVNRLGIVQAIAHGVDRPANAREDEGTTVVGDDEGGTNPEHQPGERKKKNILDEFATNLNELAKQGRIDPLIGRELEVERIIQILCRRRKNNPLLVGDAGVGKTALAEGLAFRVVNKDVPEHLLPAVIYSLDMASLLAGAKFRGDFEQRLRGVLKEIAGRRQKGEEIILFIDEIHTVMGAGATGGGSMDASNLLKPYLSNGQVHCIGSTTHEEYRKFVEKDSAFNRRFQKVDVEEPSQEDSVKIIMGLKERFEDHHGVHFSAKVIKAAVELADKYITDRRLPDKAIDLIDEAGAMVRLKKKATAAKKTDSATSTASTETTEATSPAVVVTPAEANQQTVTPKRPTGPRINVTLKDLEMVVAKVAKVPEKSVVGDEKDKLKGLKNHLQMLIFGQDEAIKKVTDTILLARSGLGNEHKPLASFLFAGPTGVGKTELAKQLALHLGVHFERYDMSEYMEKHAVAKLIGAPPGYVGHENGGILTDAIKKNPYCVLLLDEIEKAHPDIYNVLLQVMDHGSLTDSQGRTSNFRNVVIIMTTNAGAKDMEAGSIGFGSKSTVDVSKRDAAIRNFFTPEFRNRLDLIVHFNKLADDHIISVVDKFLAQVEARLVAKGVVMKVELAARKYLARTGFDEKLGARPIERLINEKITKPLSQELLFGQLEKGGTVEIGLKNASESPINGPEELTFTFTSKQKSH